MDKDTNTVIVYPTDEQAALVDRMSAIIKRTNKMNPDPKAIGELRAAMDEHPDLWRVLYDLGEQTTNALVGMVNGNALVAESVRRGAMAMRDELGAPTASPLERGLIEAVVQAWLVQQAVQRRYADKQATSMTLAVADYWERKLGSAQRRYLRACESLARVRRLLTPAVQVNVARQQVNVAGAQVNVPAPPVANERGEVVDGAAREAG